MSVWGIALAAWGGAQAAALHGSLDTACGADLAKRCDREAIKYMTGVLDKPGHASADAEVSTDMDWENLLALCCSVALAGYLVYALIHPERF
jgi:K+-transporting ATPase KdpF subunit